MKITIHSLDELYELSEVIAYGIDARDAARLVAASPRGWEMTESDATEHTKSVTASFDKLKAALERKPEVAEVAASVESAVADTSAALRAEPETEPSPSLPDEAAVAPELDADGRRWDARIDSSNKGLNKDGTWRARRNHGLSDEEVAAIKVEAMAEDPNVEEADQAAVTETHPLPVDEPESETEAKPELEATEDAALQATFFELVEQARKPAEDIQKDDIAATLQAAQAFTKAHSPHAFRLLRKTITDKTLPGMTPGERRVLLAAMELYKPGGEA